MYSDRLYTTLVELVRIPSTPGHEEEIRAYLTQYLSKLGLVSQVDGSGNLVACLDGEGTPLLLNAHMDRVPPGRGHEPVLRNGILYSDGTTNLGADDAAGMTIILEVVRRIIEQQLPHPPLLLVFTVQEEAGLCGANNFDAKPWHVSQGIVFDNAFEAGAVVSQGAAYEAFDIKISGRTGHPGKDLSQTINAIDIFRAACYPHGSLADDQTRINIGRVIAGSARNAVPDSVLVEGELRSFASQQVRDLYKQMISDAFMQAAQQSGGQVEISFTTHSTGYALSPDEPLLQAYREVLAQRGVDLKLHPTFIGSDTSGFRPDIKTFTLSTGVVNEHSVDEYIALAPLEQIVLDILQVLVLWCQRKEA